MLKEKPYPPTSTPKQCMRQRDDKLQINRKQTTSYLNLSRKPLKTSGISSAGPVPCPGKSCCCILDVCWSIATSEGAVGKSLQSLKGPAGPRSILLTTTGKSVRMTSSSGLSMHVLANSNLQTYELHWSTTVNMGSEGRVVRRLEGAMRTVPTCCRRVAGSLLQSICLPTLIHQ